MRVQYQITIGLSNGTQKSTPCKYMYWSSRHTFFSSNSFDIVQTTDGMICIFMFHLFKSPARMSSVESLLVSVELLLMLLQGVEIDRILVRFVSLFKFVLQFNCIETYSRQNRELIAYM